MNGDTVGSFRTQVFVQRRASRRKLSSVMHTCITAEKMEPRNLNTDQRSRRCLVLETVDLKKQILNHTPVSNRKDGWDVHTRRWVCHGSPCEAAADEPPTVTTDVGSENQRRNEGITPEMAVFSKWDLIMKEAYSTEVTNLHFLSPRGWPICR